MVTTKLFGWQKPLYYTNYSHDYEGLPDKYDKFLGYYDEKFDNIEEIHFKYIQETENAIRTTELFGEDE